MRGAGKAVGEWRWTAAVSSFPGLRSPLPCSVLSHLHVCEWGATISWGFLFRAAQRLRRAAALCLFCLALHAGSDAALGAVQALLPLGWDQHPSCSSKGAICRRYLREINAKWKWTPLTCCANHKCIIIGPKLYLFGKQSRKCQCSAFLLKCTQIIVPVTEAYFIFSLVPSSLGTGTVLSMQQSTP